MKYICTIIVKSPNIINLNTDKLTLIEDHLGKIDTIGIKSYVE